MGFNLPDQPFQGTQAECEQLCLEQSECQAFSWPVSVAPTTQHNCWLKTSSLASVQCQGSGCWMTVQVKGCEEKGSCSNFLATACAVNTVKKGGNVPCLGSQTTCDSGTCCEACT